MRTILSAAFGLVFCGLVTAADPTINTVDKVVFGSGATATTVNVTTGGSYPYVIAPTACRGKDILVKGSYTNQPNKTVLLSSTVTQTVGMIEHVVNGDLSFDAQTWKFSISYPSEIITFDPNGWTPIRIWWPKGTGDGNGNWGEVWLYVAFAD